MVDYPGLVMKEPYDANNIVHFFGYFAVLLMPSSVRSLILQQYQEPRVVVA